MEIPLRITDNRTKSNLQKLFSGLFRQVISTSTCQAAILHKCWPYPHTTEEGIELVDRDVTNSEQANDPSIDCVFHGTPCLPIGLAQPTRP